MEERGTRGEIKSLVLVISGGNGKSSLKEVVILGCVKMSECPSFLEKGEMCKKKSSENVVLLFEIRLCSKCSNLCKKKMLPTSIHFNYLYE